MEVFFCIRAINGLSVLSFFFYIFETGWGYLSLSFYIVGKYESHIYLPIIYIHVLCQICPVYTCHGYEVSLQTFIAAAYTTCFEVWFNFYRFERGILLLTYVG